MINSLSRLQGSWHYIVVSFLVLGEAIASIADCASAQIAPDTTLGNENSTVTSTDSVDQIDGGAIRGANLFHSFQEFNINEGRAAYFTNPSGIENILSRVTGNSRSNILGKLGVLGNANLFLINPNGIIFGPNASLDIGGSFLASTASSLKFADGTEFRATAAQTTPLLTVSVPLGLQYGKNATSILNQSKATNSEGQLVGLQVKPSKTLALVGGSVKLDGGIVQSPASRVELGGLAGEGTVGLNFDRSELRLSFPNDTTRADVLLTNGAKVDVTAGGGGSITVTARNLDILGKSTLADGIGARQGTVGSQAGDITLDTTDAITISQSSRVLNTFSNRATGGQAGNIYIKAGSLTIDSLGRVSTGQSRAEGTGQGKSGNISAQTTGSVTLSATDTGNNSAFSTLSFGGNAGNVSILANGSISISDSEIVAASFEGSAGTISLQANDFISINKNSFIASNVFNGTGNGGDITIKAGGSVSIADISWIATQSGLGRERPQLGNGGNIYIEGQSLSVTGGSQLSTRTFSFGNAGNIQIKTSDFVEVFGRYPFILPDTANIIRLKGRGYSTLLTRTEAGANGTGGEISITTGTLRVFDGGTLNAQSRSAFRGGNIIVNANVLDMNRGGQLLTTASSSGDAGDIIINAKDRIAIASSNPDYFTFFNQVSQLKDFSGSIGSISPLSGVFANTTEQSTGRGGSLQIATKWLAVRDGAQVSVSSQLGNAGNITVTAGSIRLENNGSLTATTQSGNGGNITLRLRDLLLLRRNSQISTTAGTAGAGGDGGNIDIDTKFLIAVPDENSDITANAFEGRGGFIRITAQGVFGIEPRERLTPLSDITAFSQLNPELNGVVEINSPEVDPNRGLVELPSQPVNVEVAQGCQPASSQQASLEFFNTGRGGIAPNPYEPLSNSTLWEDVPTPTTTSAATPPDRIVEAQGWILDDKGAVTLVAAMPSSSSPASCSWRSQQN